MQEILQETFRNMMGKNSFKIHNDSFSKIFPVSIPLKDCYMDLNYSENDLV